MAKKLKFLAGASGHPWAFAKMGGFNQVVIQNGEDLRHLGELDQKLWCALSCPTKGLEFDARTLQLLDTDGDGRIRVNEVKAAVAWVCRCLKDPGVIIPGGDVLKLAELNPETEEGARVLASARHVLVCTENDGGDSVSLADAMNQAAIFSEDDFNGDGIVPPGLIEDEALRAVVSDIVASVGGVADRSGVPGVDEASSKTFFELLAGLIEWKAKAAADASICPVGEATADANDALAAVQSKVDDYFARCRLAAFDKRSIAALNREEKDYLAIAARDMTISDAEIQALPLATVDAGKPLPLVNGLNPAWVERMAAFREKVVTPILGASVTAITPDHWATICAKFGPYREWVAAKPAAPAVAAMEGLGYERLAQIASMDAASAIGGVIAADLAVKAEAEALEQLEKLLRFKANLFRLLNNFVSFVTFYRREEPAVFQAGMLYLDNRSYDLCVTVQDMGKHTMMVGSSRMYLMYCDCVRPSGEKKQIAAAITDGDCDDIIVGRNGVFYDREGRDWDATITKIVDNPIGIRQAFWSPYKKLMRFIEETMAKRAAAAEAASDAKLKGAATAAPGAVAAAADGKAPVTPKKLDIGVVAAIGVAVGGITAAFGVIMQALFGLGIWLPVALVGIMLLISGPSMAMAALKLRQRNLGPLLDANGWAINAKAKVNIIFGKGLTRLATLPDGSSLSMIDPWAKKKRRKWPWVLLLIVVLGAGGYLLWNRGDLNPVLPDSMDRRLSNTAETLKAAPAPEGAAATGTSDQAPAPASAAPAGN